MKRRKFIKNTSSFIIGTSFVPAIFAEDKKLDFTLYKRSEDRLKGFIVSDAHFGWMHEQQPDPEFQKEMMSRIMSRFPDLDVFFDTGDAHHNDHHENSDPYLARKNWCDIIQGGCGQVPFYYVIGNHEIRSNEDDDPELRSNIMGSSSCRPYYSFDMKGIHFISFPELIRAIYITEEEYAWLNLDLELNRDKTTILLSHNNILGTTSGNEEGYRGLIDSDKMMAIFKKNPNIISWMHGHNHNFEIIEKQNMLFVSNGRIGGFDPSFGKHGLGGIYFEISKNGLIVKCYSAEKDIFLEELSMDLTKELAIPTTLDPFASYTYSYGVGGAKHREKFFVYNHHSGKNQSREMYIANCKDAIINDDPYFRKYAERHAWHGMDKILLAAKINHGNSVFEYTNPGIRLKKNNDWWTTVTLPSDNFNLYSYYRCPLDTLYKIAIDLKTFQVNDDGKQVMWLRLIVHNSDGKVLRIVQSEGIILSEGVQKHESLLRIPSLENHETIYNNSNSDNLVNVAVEASFSGMEKGDIDIKSIIFSIEASDDKISETGLVVNGESCLNKEVKDNSDIIKLLHNPKVIERDVIESSSNDKKRLTFLVKHSNLEWQVRNAAVKDMGDYLEIKKMRNRLSDRMEIIIVPLFSTSDPYIHRIRRAEEIKIFPITSRNKELKVEIGKVMDDSQIQVFSTKKPRIIKNVTSWNYENNIIEAEISKAGIITFYF